MAKAVKFKARISGNAVEFWEWEKPIFIEGNNGGGRRKKDAPESEKSSEYKKQNDRKSKDTFKSLVATNFKDGDKFLTLTFRDTTEFDIKNHVETNVIFKKFIQRLRYYCKTHGGNEDFKYIAVIEFQDKFARGAVHYHLVADLPYIRFEKLGEIWGHGFIGINSVKGVDNVGVYLTKYMAKNNGDLRLKGKKNYLPSKNLDKPIMIYGNEAGKLKKEFKETKKEVFTDMYESEHFGKTLYDDYNLKRDNPQTKVGKGLQEQYILEQKIQQYLDQKRSKEEKVEPLIEKVNKFMEDLNNGAITYDRRILDDVYSREGKAVSRRRNRGDILEELLECLQKADFDTNKTEEWREYSTGQEQWEQWLAKQELSTGL
jgi:hypothetical protein